MCLKVQIKNKPTSREGLLVLKSLDVAKTYLVFVEIIVIVARTNRDEKSNIMAPPWGSQRREPPEIYKIKILKNNLDVRECLCFGMWLILITFPMIPA